MRKIDLRKLFDVYNDSVGGKLKCKKLYIVPSLRHTYYYVKETDENRKLSALAYISNDRKYTINEIHFNPDLSDKGIKENLIEIISEAVIVGDNWDALKSYQDKLTKIV